MERPFNITVRKAGESFVWFCDWALTQGEINAHLNRYKAPEYEVVVTNVKVKDNDPIEDWQTLD